MEIKDEQSTMAIDAHGIEYVAETNAVYSMEGSDGTHYEAEITTTAHADDPTVVDSHMVIIQTDADGFAVNADYIACHYLHANIEKDAK